MWERVVSSFGGLGLLGLVEVVVSRMTVASFVSVEI